jgi:hypothetical protein
MPISLLGLQRAGDPVCSGVFICKRLITRELLRNDLNDVQPRPTPGHKRRADGRAAQTVPRQSFGGNAPPKYLPWLVPPFLTISFPDD